MITSSRRPALSPPVTRHFESTRIQNQLIALAYQALIPVVSRPLERPGPRPRPNQPITIQGLRSKAGGACPAMTNDQLRVGLYGRVSGDQQEKEDTIASQL